MKDGTENFHFRQKQCLKIMGYSVSLNSNKNEESVFKKLWQYLIIFVVFSSLYPIISYAHYNRDNIDLLTASLSLICIVFLNTTKMATLLFNKRIFLEIMDQLKDMWKKNPDVFAKTRLKEINNFSNRVVNTYFYIMTFTTVYFVISPLMKLAWALITQQPFIRQWITPMRFFFNPETSPGYEFALLYITAVSVPAVVNLIAIDGLFVSFTANLCAHFGILQHQIETNEFTETDEMIDFEIRSFVKYHIVILDLAAKICKAYKPVIFGQFLMTSLQMCVIVYQISKHMDNIIGLIANICFICTVMIQLLIYCYGGEIIKLESLKVGTSVQLSKWYRLQPKYRKMLCLLMLRSQRAVIFESGFYDASLASFMLIIKAASSYITLIQSFE